MPVANEPTEEQKKNIETAKEFVDAFATPDIDYEALLTRYFHDDALIRWRALQEAGQIGPAAAAAKLREHLPPGAAEFVNYNQIVAVGPVVVIWRTDTLKIPGMDDRVFDSFGVHVFKDGKMQEFADYFGF
jgi:limonene-1,2-epoxide hydrolase